MKLSEAKKYYQAGVPLNLIAEEAELPVCEIYYALGIPYDEDEKYSRWAHLYDKGKNDFEISRITGDARSTIQGWRKRTGRTANKRTKGGSNGYL